MDIQIKDDAMIGGDVNVTNIVERNKSDREIRQEQLNRYRAKCREVFADNIVDERERTMLNALAGDLHISKEEARQIEESEASISKKQRAQLDKISLVVLKQLIKKFRSADFDGVAKLFTKLKGMNSTFDDEEVHFYYNLILSVFNSNDCIRQYESRKEDNYWQSYWAVMACLKANKPSQAETIKNSLANWKDYEEENVLLLEIAIAILNNDFEMADALREVAEATYSPALQDFAEALFLVLLSNDDYAGMSPEPHTLFYVDGMLAPATGRTGIGTLQPDGTLTVQQQKEGFKTKVSITPGKSEIPSVPKECLVKMAMKPLPEAIHITEEEYYRSKFGRKGYQDNLYLIYDKNENFFVWHITQELAWPLEGKYRYIYPQGMIYRLEQDDGNNKIFDFKNKWFSIDSFNRIYVEGRLINVTDDNGKWGLIDSEDGTWLLDIEYNAIDACKDNILKVKKDGNYALYDSKAKTFVTKFDYTYVCDCGNFLECKKLNHSEDYFSPIHNFIWKGCDMDYHPLFSNIAIFERNEKKAICNTENKDVKTDWFDNILIEWYDENEDEDKIKPLIFVGKQNKWGLLDAGNGNFILNIEYDDVNCDNSPYMVLTKDNQSYTYNMYTRQFE